MSGGTTARVATIFLRVFAENCFQLRANYLHNAPTGFQFISEGTGRKTHSGRFIAEVCLEALSGEAQKPIIHRRRTTC